MPFQVKALQKTAADAPYRVALIQRRDPRPDDVVIDIVAAGICHSDIHTIWNEWGNARYPLTVGHEIAGVVSAVGDAVTKFKVGDRVGVGCMVNSCQECAECTSGHENCCLNGGVVGTYNSYDVDGTVTQGGYSEKVVVNENFVLRIPDNLDFFSAAPLLCAGITTYSPLATWDVKAGSRVAVVGLGGLGHMGVQIAAAKGAEVTVLSRSLAKEKEAAELGAVRTLATTEPGFFENHQGEFDMILNTISADLDIDAYMRLLAPRGAMVMVGLPPADQSINVRSVIFGRKAFAGSNIGGIPETQEMLDFCAEHGFGAVIEKISADQVDETYQRVVNGEVKFRAVIDIATLSAAPVEAAN